jgi:hypothetical protein
MNRHLPLRLNKYLPPLMAALLLTGASYTFAASSTDLIVRGIITPAACTPNLSSNGVIDYGTISSRDLNQTTPTFLGQAALQLNVDCEAATLFALNLADNRPDSSIFPLLMYGLGLINTNQRLGGYYLSYDSAITENGSKELLGSVDQGQTWSNYEGEAINPGTWAAFGDRSSGSWFPAAIQHLTVNLNIGASIARADSLTLTHEVPIDGHATLEVKYI